MVVNSVSFIPIQSCSDRADQLVARQKEGLAKYGNNYPPGPKKQYELQIELLANPRVPDYEILFFPFVLFIPVPEPSKPYITILPTLARPFTRGTIVRVFSLRHLEYLLISF
jgi:hypothetical protein